MSKYEADYIKYRLSRAKETFEEAQLLATKARWNGCVNRLYYACFYAVSALLYKHGINSKTHSGTNTQFAHHFVKSEKASKEAGE